MKKRPKIRSKKSVFIGSTLIIKTIAYSQSLEELYNVECYFREMARGYRESRRNKSALSV